MINCKRIQKYNLKVIASWSAVEVYSKSVRIFKSLQHVHNFSIFSSEHITIIRFETLHAVVDLLRSNTSAPLDFKTVSTQLVQVELILHTPPKTIAGWRQHISCKMISPSDHLPLGEISINV